MTQRWWIAVGLSLVLASSVRAEPLDALLEQAGGPAELRARLEAHVAALADTSPEDAGRSLYLLGRSFERDGALDSAIVAYRRAIEVRGAGDELIAAADALLRRSSSGDADEALGYASRAIGSVAAHRIGASQVRARIAWAQFLAGKTAPARTQFQQIERSLGGGLLWKLRSGQVFVEAGDPQRAVAALTPVAVWSRGGAEEAQRLLGRAVTALGGSQRLDQEVAYQIALRDRVEQQLITALGGRRLRFTGADRFPLGGTLVAPTGKAARPAVVALVAPGDTLAVWDSVAVALRRAGFASMFLDLRGTGWSVGANVPIPEAWIGRENALTERSAEDVSEALRALGGSTPLAAGGYTLVASGQGAAAAIVAAERDPRVRALVLLSPSIDVTDRGAMLARLRRAKVPLYLLQTDEDQLNLAWLEPLYLAGPPGVSLMTEARGHGRGPETLREDGAALARLVRWLKEKRPARAAAAPPPATPPRR